MDGYEFTFGQQGLIAQASGALWWPERRLLCVSDLHFGKSQRIARRGGTLLPPYDVADTLALLDTAIDARDPTHVICLGDSFDDLEAADLPDPDRLWLTRLMAGRRWTWVEGNHDPGPLGLGGEHRAIVGLDGLTFRHIAQAGSVEAEISGHFHPKARVAGQSRPCFLMDKHRLILPAFGTYTGGLASTDPVFVALMAPDARAILTGRAALAIPMPRGKG